MLKINISSGGKKYDININGVNEESTVDIHIPELKNANTSPILEQKTSNNVLLDNACNSILEACNNMEQAINNLLNISVNSRNGITSEALGYSSTILNLLRDHLRRSIDNRRLNTSSSLENLLLTSGNRNFLNTRLGSRNRNYPQETKNNHRENTNNHSLMRGYLSRNYLPEVKNNNRENKIDRTDRINRRYEEAKNNIRQNPHLFDQNQLTNLNRMISFVDSFNNRRSNLLNDSKNNQVVANQTENNQAVTNQTADDKLPEIIDSFSDDEDICYDNKGMYSSHSTETKQIENKESTETKQIENKESTETKQIENKDSTETKQIENKESAEKKSNKMLFDDAGNKNRNPLMIEDCLKNASPYYKRLFDEKSYHMNFFIEIVSQLDILIRFIMKNENKNTSDAGVKFDIYFSKHLLKMFKKMNDSDYKEFIRLTTESHPGETEELIDIKKRLEKIAASIRGGYFNYIVDLLDTRGCDCYYCDN